MSEPRLSRLLALALVALVLLDFPVLAVVDRITLGGVPVLPFYLFLVWGTVILLAAWSIERFRGE
jgi:hypothetical protein